MERRLNHCFRSNALLLLHKLAQYAPCKALLYELGWLPAESRVRRDP